jgi:hypothetical protein
LGSGIGLTKAADGRLFVFTEQVVVAMTAPAPSSPIWDYARKSILDFRDAVAVQDPESA